MTTMTSPFINPPHIHIHPGVRRGFIRRAWKAYPNEYIEVLAGTADMNNIWVHLALGVAHRATHGSVEVSDDAEMEDAFDQAREKGLYIVGTWHTHPLTVKENDLREMVASLSMTDHQEGHRCNELISAVSVLWIGEKGRKLSRTEWWLPQGKIKVSSS